MQSVKVRASSLPELFDCPARWEARHLLKMRLPTSGAAQLGTAVHAGAAVYDESRMANAGLTIDDAAGAVVDSIWKPEDEIVWGDDWPQPEAEKTALALHKSYCQKIAPRQDYVAIESACDDLVISDIGITLTGTPDRIRQTDDGLGIADIKTSKTAVAADGTVNMKAHALQLEAYELLVANTIGKPMRAPAEIIGLNAAKTEKARRVATADIASPREILLDGEDGEPGLLRVASRIVHSGDFYGNPSSNLCSEKYCPRFRTCKWRR